MTPTPGTRPASPDARPTLGERIAALDDTLWRRCPVCSAQLYRPRLDRSANVCPECGHHFPMDAPGRLDLLADRGTLALLADSTDQGDPLGFVDRVPYPDRLAAARRRFGRGDAALAAELDIHGIRAVVFVLDFAFLGGSMGQAVGEQFTRAAERAAAEALPMVAICSSGGARMQEGALSLMQMARTSAAVDLLHRAGQPFVSVLADPCFGGVTASFASLGDVILAEPGARAGFAGRAVIEQTVREKLPDDFQTAQSLLDNGHIDRIVARASLRGALAGILSSYRRTPGPADAVDWSARRPRGSAPRWDAVQVARRPERLQVRDVLDACFDSFTEFHGDRRHGDDLSIVAGVARLAGRPTVVVGHQRGRTTAERVAHRFGMAGPAGYRKVLRALQHAQTLGLPVVSFIDTPGAYPGADAELQNQSGEIARCIESFVRLTVPTVAIVLGEGGSGGALALGATDRLLMMAGATLSVISPEGCATILFGDAGRAPEAADALRPDAWSLYDLGLVDEVVAECRTTAGTAVRLRAALAATVGRLSDEPVPRRLDRRRQMLLSGAIRRPVDAATGGPVRQEVDPDAA